MASTQPALKIKLRLNGPAKPDRPTASPVSSTNASPAPIKQPAEEDLGSHNKKPKLNRQNRRTIQTSKPKEVVEEDLPDDNSTSTTTTTTTTPVSTPQQQQQQQQQKANGSSGSNNNNNSISNRTQQSNSSSSTSKARKDLLKYKDVKARKWTSAPLTFYTLDGGEISLSSWRSDEPMALNKRKTEPVTVAEIDQLFSAASGERDFRPFLCTHHGCSKSFTSYDQLQTHETNMHGAKKLVCGIDGCHKSFVTPGQLTKHRKMVHFRAARKAKIAAAAAAAAAAATEEASTPTETNAPTPTNDEESSTVDISED